MQLARDGKVAMQLNCNRAMGSWKSTAAATASSGPFEFGPLAGTRALCPPPSLDQRILAQASQVRDFSLKDGRLTLNLLANAGSLVWEPADIEIPFLTVPDATLEAAILQAAPQFTRAVADAGGGSARYVHARIDLNGDGKPEVFAFLMDPLFFCGTGGCNLMLFTEQGGRLVLVNDFPISRPPVIVSPRRTGGWNDLIRVESGGGGPATYLRHTFDGKRYVPAERTPVGEESPEGKRVLAGELGPKVGAPLVPR